MQDSTNGSETQPELNPQTHTIEETQTTIIKRKRVYVFVSENSKRLRPFLKATWRPLPRILLWLSIIIFGYVAISVVAHSNWYLFHDFFRLIEWAGVVLSLAVTLYVYWICNDRGWIRQFPEKIQTWMFLPFFIATMISGAVCIASIGYIRTHLTCLTIYFLIFIIWDWLIWHVKKRPEALANRVDEMERKAAHWFQYVDFPTPLFFWAVYSLSRLSIYWNKSPSDPYHAADSFLTGAIAATLLAQAWGWYLDCRHFLENPINRTIFEKDSVQVVSTVTETGVSSRDR